MKRTRKGFTLVELLIVVAIMASLSAMMMMASSESIDIANANAILGNLHSMKVSAYEMYMTVPEVAALNAITGNDQAVTLTGETTATTVGKILAGRMGRKALVAADAYSIVGDDKHWYVVYELQGTDSPLVKQILADKAAQAGLLGGAGGGAAIFDVDPPLDFITTHTHAALMVR